LAKKRTPEDYKKALALITEIETINDELQKSSGKMQQVALIMGYLRTYARKLIISESILLVILLPLGLFLLPDSLFAIKATAKRTIFLISGLVIAPAIALAMSFHEFSKKTTPPKGPPKKP
jgi:hypothetical protein